MKYFHNCHTAEDVKHQFRENAKKYHPDLGGNPEDFKAMYIEFEQLWEQYKNIHRNAEGKTYEKETTETPDEFADIINTLVRLNGVQVEICGSWIWASGNTMTHKDTLKQLGFKWAHKKKAWYYHSEPYRKRSHRKLTLDEIREMFGSQSYSAKAEEEKKLKAVV